MTAGTVFFFVFLCKTFVPGFLPAAKQVANGARWRRHRVDWLRAAVGLSIEQQQRQLPMHTFLHDERMLGHDDGEGKPLRYLSWYGGIVTRFL
jgi:hypothetical protein